MRIPKCFFNSPARQRLIDLSGSSLTRIIEESLRR